MVGESVMEHVRRLRLERAAFRLKFSDQPVTRVAFEAGYETHEAFTRAFGAMFGLRRRNSAKAHRALPYPRPRPASTSRADGRLTGFQPSIRRPTDGRPHRTVPAIRVAFMRHVGPYCEAGAAWERLQAWAGPRGLFGPRTLVLGVCHDDPEVTPADKVRYDACVTVDERSSPRATWASRRSAAASTP